MGIVAVVTDLISQESVADVRIIELRVHTALTGESLRAEIDLFVRKTDYERKGLRQWPAAP